MTEEQPGGPSRRQKRWSGRLRMGGVVLALLGAVGVADAVLSGFGAWPAAAFLVFVGGFLYAVGRRWGRGSG